MADLERAKQALINAHNAGDTAAAKEIANYIKSQQLQQTAGVEPVKNDGIVGRIQEDWQKRDRNMAEIRKKYDAGQMSLPSGMYQVGMEGASKVSDVIGEGVNSAMALAGKLPSFGGGTIGERIPQEIGAMIPQSWKDSAASAATSWKGFEKEHPEIAGNIRATGQLLNFMGNVPVGAAAIRAGGSVAKAAGLGATAKGVKNIYKGATARGAEALDSALENITDAASQSYSKMRAVGADFTPQASSRIASNIESALISDGPLNPTLHDKVLAAVKDIKGNGFTNVEQLDQWRQVLGDIAGNFSDKVNARKARLMIRAIDDSMLNVGPADLANGGQEAIDALMQGRKTWAQRAKFEAVSDIVKGAGNDANKLKRDLEKLLLNKKKTAGWSKQELSALKDAARQTTGEGILKMLGKFGFDLGSSRSAGNTALPILGAALSGGGGLAAGAGLGGAAIPAASAITIGTAARMGQKALARGKAENLLQTIEGGLPLSEIMKLPPKEAKALLKQVKK